MRDALTVIGVGAVAILCCSALPLVVAVTGLTTAAALGVGGAVVGAGMLAVTVVSVERSRRHACQR